MCRKAALGSRPPSSKLEAWVKDLTHRFLLSTCDLHGASCSTETPAALIQKIGWTVVPTHQVAIIKWIITHYVHHTVHRTTQVCTYIQALYKALGFAGITSQRSSQCQKKRVLSIKPIHKTVMAFKPRSDICHTYYKDTKVQQLELISETRGGGAAKILA